MARLPRTFAAFDIDGTLFRSSLLIELTDELIRRGIFPQSAQEGFAREFELWKNREGSYENYIESVVEVFRIHIQGVHYGEVADASAAIMEQLNRRTYRYTHELIEHLKKQGYFLLAISHSPKTTLDYFVDYYGFDKAYGSIYEIGPEDRFTGVRADEHIISNKANIIRRLLDKEHVTLEGSVGVGDTESDIPFLELVDDPICFNPNQRLYKHAKRMGWKVVVERKDVVYEM